MLFPQDFEEKKKECIAVATGRYAAGWKEALGTVSFRVLCESPESGIPVPPDATLARFQVRNVDERTFPVSRAPRSSILLYNTGRDYGSVGWAFNIGTEANSSRAGQ